MKQDSGKLQKKADLEKSPYFMEEDVE